MMNGRGSPSPSGNHHAYSLPGSTAGRRIALDGPETEALPDRAGAARPTHSGVGLPHLAMAPLTARPQSAKRAASPGFDQASDRNSGDDLCLTPRNIGPRLDEDGIYSTGGNHTPRSLTSSQRMSTSAEQLVVHKSVRLRRCEVIYMSPQVIVSSFGSPDEVARLRAKAKQAASQSVWSGDGVVIKSAADKTRERIEVEAAEEMAAFMDAEHEGKYCAVLSAQALLKGPWIGPMDLIEASDYEPPTLEYAMELIHRLWAHLRASPDNVVVIMRNNIIVSTALLSLTVTGIGSGGKMAQLLKRICHITTEPLPGPCTMRHLAMLHHGLKAQVPKNLSAAPVMSVGTIRLYGDHEFVRSTESLIRINIEIYHSGVIDSTDFREQIQNRVIREDSDACLTLNFVPVEVRSDVRALVCGTLAGETGLVTGPQPMFQVWFHTSHIDVMRPLVFLDKDFDPFQKSCPVTRLEFVPGQRPEEHLVAPEVKFVRKKAAKTNSGPLGFISNMLSNKPEQTESVEAARSRTQEARVMGKVFRDDQGTAAEDIVAVLESEADDYIQVSGPHTPRGGGWALNQAKEKGGGGGSGRTTPLTWGTPRGGNTPRSQSPSLGAMMSPRGGGARSPRVPVPAGSAMDGEMPASVAGQLTPRKWTKDGSMTPRTPGHGGASPIPRGGAGGGGGLLPPPSPRARLLSPRQNSVRAQSTKMTPLSIDTENHPATTTATTTTTTNTNNNSINDRVVNIAKRDRPSTPVVPSNRPPSPVVAPPIASSPRNHRGAPIAPPRKSGAGLSPRDEASLPWVPSGSQTPRSIQQTPRSASQAIGGAGGVSISDLNSSMHSGHNTPREPEWAAPLGAKQDGGGGGGSTVSGLVLGSAELGFATPREAKGSGGATPATNNNDVNFDRIETTQTPRSIFSIPPSVLLDIQVDVPEAEAAAANKSHQNHKAPGDAIVAPPPSVVTDSKSNQQIVQGANVDAAGAGGGGGISILPGAEELSGNKADLVADLEGQMVPDRQMATSTGRGLSGKKLAIVALVMFLIIVIGLGIALGVTKCFGSC